MRVSMLVVLMAFTLILGALSPAPVQAFGSTARVVSADQHQVLSYAQEKKLDIDIDVNKGGGGGGRWYANPVWMAIGGLAVVLFLVLIVMAFRGGTTVVK